MTLLLEVTEYADAAHWRWRLTTEGGAFIAGAELAGRMLAIVSNGLRAGPPG